MSTWIGIGRGTQIWKIGLAVRVKIRGHATVFPEHSIFSDDARGYRRKLVFTLEKLDPNQINKCLENIYENYSQLLQN